MDTASYGYCHTWLHPWRRAAPLFEVQKWNQGPRNISILGRRGYIIQRFRIAARKVHHKFPDCEIRVRENWDSRLEATSQSMRRRGPSRGASRHVVQRLSSRRPCAVWCGETIFVAPATGQCSTRECLPFARNARKATVYST